MSDKLPVISGKERKFFALAQNDKVVYLSRAFLFLSFTHLCHAEHSEASISGSCRDPESLR
jgi:hypothetical protein